LNIDVLKKDLVADGFLHDVIYFKEIDSTQQYAKSPQNRCRNDTLIITSHQKKGVGRFGREWESMPDENLTFSLVKHFEIKIDEIHLVNFYSTFILYDTLRKMYSASGLTINLKWPNDVLINNKKAAGFLLDVSDLKNELKKFVIGAGINVNQENFSERISYKATSLMNELNERQSTGEILKNYILNFYSNFSLIENKEELMNKWRSAAGIKGKKILFKIVADSSEVPATVLDIDHDGGLKVMFEDGKKSKYYSGEISMVY
jgi:BirA family biotin operon repressor/biotin-[acetyl-CoA-carboxylase] ligase